jgi:hypothetical protein
MRISVEAEVRDRPNWKVGVPSAPQIWAGSPGIIASHGADVVTGRFRQDIEIK